MTFTKITKRKHYQYFISVGGSIVVCLLITTSTVNLRRKWNYIIRWMAHRASSTENQVSLCASLWFFAAATFKILRPPAPIDMRHPFAYIDPIHAETHRNLRRIFNKNYTGRMRYWHPSISYEHISSTFFAVERETTHAHTKLKRWSVFCSKWADHRDFVEMVVLYYNTIGNASLVFMLCEPGHYCSTGFESIEDQLVQCDWYLLPMELQRKYMVFLAQTQNPIQISCYFNIVCERETSKKVFIAPIHTRVGIDCTVCWSLVPLNLTELELTFVKY